MGIRKKIYFGFIIIGFILFLSGLICVIQLAKIGKSVTGFLSDNAITISLSKKIAEEVDNQVWGVFQQTIDNKSSFVFNDHLYNELIAAIEKNITEKGEKEIIDSLKVSYQIYKSNSLAVDSLLLLPNLDRSEWLENYYKPSVTRFTHVLKRLQIINEEAIITNSDLLKSNFYQMIMPPIIAIVIGLLLVMLFNYFINIYFISPLLKINKGIRLYSENRLPYNVKVETEDEIEDLNQGVKNLISMTKRNNPA